MTATTLTKRWATPADIEAIVTLVESAYRGDSGRQGWTTESDLIAGQRTDVEEVSTLMTTPDTYFLLAEDKGHLIASCLLEHQGDALYFGMFAVQPTRQGDGTGKQMIAWAEEHARSLNCSSVRMQVISVRKELIAWYQRRGYQETGETMPFPYGQERFGIPLRDDLYFVEMVKSLV